MEKYSDFNKVLTFQFLSLLLKVSLSSYPIPILFYFSFFYNFTFITLLSFIRSISTYVVRSGPTREGVQDKSHWRGLTEPCVVPKQREVSTRK